MKKAIFIFSIIFYSAFAHGQLNLDLSDSTTYRVGFETSFDVNYSDTFVYLDSNTTKTFETIVQFHKNNPTFLLELGVHQGPFGSSEFNLKQSELRAIRIMELLESKFQVDISKFIIIGYGESNPILKLEDISQYRFIEDDNLMQVISNLNLRLSVKILKIK